jgi:hypothetical protein
METNWDITIGSQDFDRRYGSLAAIESAMQVDLVSMENNPIIHLSSETTEENGK